MSEQRLIDANALKEAIEITQYNDIDDLTRTERLIDNAQTVEISGLPKIHYDRGFIAGYEKGKNERPQGGWIIIGEEIGALGLTYKTKKCSKCGWEHSLLIPENYCPNCGAEMQ